MMIWLLVFLNQPLTIYHATQVASVRSLAVENCEELCIHYLGKFWNMEVWWTFVLLAWCYNFGMSKSLNLSHALHLLVFGFFFSIEISVILVLFPWKLWWCYFVTVTNRSDFVLPEQIKWLESVIFGLGAKI